MCGITGGYEMKYKIIALVGKTQSEFVAEALLRLALFLEEKECTVIFESETVQHCDVGQRQVMSLEEIAKQAQLVVVLGGDGTMLGVARRLAPYQIPLVGVNQGRVGFMTDIAQENMLPILDEIVQGHCEIEQRTLLEGVVSRQGKESFSGLAFNDIVVSRGAGSGMVELRVSVDGHFMYDQRSDGLIASTPTGSTAYALSAGGALLHPDLNGIILVPIAPHTLSNRPIVIADSSEIMIEIVNQCDASVNFDMQSFIHLSCHDQLRIRRSAHRVTFIHPRGWNYYDTLRKKLHWNDRPRGINS